MTSFFRRSGSGTYQRECRADVSICAVLRLIFISEYSTPHNIVIREYVYLLNKQIAVYAVYFLVFLWCLNQNFFIELCFISLGLIWEYRETSVIHVHVHVANKWKGSFVVYFSIIQWSSILKEEYENC